MARLAGMTASRTALMGAGLGLVLALGAWTMQDADHPPPARAAPLEAPREAVITAAPEAATIEAATAANERAQASPPVTAEVVLSGVTVGSNRPALAIASIDGGPQMVLRVGDPIGSSAKVLRIDPDSMTYGSGATEVRVWVKPDQAGTATASVQVPPKTYPGFAAAAPAIARPGGAEPGSGNRNFREAVNRKLQAIANGR